MLQNVFVDEILQKLWSIADWRIWECKKRNWKRNIWAREIRFFPLRDCCFQFSSVDGRSTRSLRSPSQHFIALLFFGTLTYVLALLCGPVSHCWSAPNSAYFRQKFVLRCLVLSLLPGASSPSVSPLLFFASHLLSYPSLRYSHISVGPMHHVVLILFHAHLRGCWSDLLRRPTIFRCFKNLLAGRPGQRDMVPGWRKDYPRIGLRRRITAGWKMY